MNKFILISSLLVLIVMSSSCVTISNRTPQTTPQADSKLQFEYVDYDTKIPMINNVSLRTGVYSETDRIDFKGCVLYLEGLADSIHNHIPLFEALSQNGYRVITFDYMGQGGSQGEMNHTRLYDVLAPTLEIGNQAKFIWERYSKINGKNNLNCSKSRKMVMGWSTGGLATYKLAFEKWADAVVLIAPGIHPKTFVGEGATSVTKMLSGAQVITKRTLTRNTFENNVDPHIDPIKPLTPIAVPLFAGNLLLTSQLSQAWIIPKTVQGIVFLSGLEDTYVNRGATIRTITENAAHFSMFAYDGALHEIDNEIPSVTNDMYKKIIDFYNRKLDKN